MSNTDVALSWCERNLSRNGSLQRDGVTWLCSNPTREDKHPSLSVDIEKRVFKDHATSEAGTITQLAGMLGCEAPAWEAEESREGKIPSARARDASDDAVRLWKSGRPATPDHPYLVAKKVDPFDLRIALDGRLMVPGYDAVTGAFKMVQAVAAKPDESGSWSKRDTGPVKGALWLVGNDKGAEDSSLVIAEGPSTAAAVKMLCPDMAVVCSFGTANLPTVYEALRKRFPDREIVIASDSGTEELAAKCRGALAVIPSASKSNHDWNDTVLELGSEEARRQFQQKLEKARAKAPKVDAPVERKPRYELVRIGDIELVEPEYLVAGLIEDKTLGQIFGASGSMKSFLTLDLAACVATGLPFHGRQVKEGPVIYLAGEGFNWIKRRLTAWELNTGVSLKDAPLYISRRAPTLASRETARDVAESIRSIAETVGHPALIVVDTLARATVGADENSNSDLGEFIETVDEIRHEHDCTLMTVHHSGLADKDRGRGASAVFAAMDFEYQVTKDGMSVALINRKTKDAAEPEPIHFRATEITVGQARNGDLITSLALEEVEDEPRERKRELTPVQKLGLDTFRAASEQFGALGKDGAYLGVHVEDWRPLFYQRHTGDNTHAKKTSFQRVRDKLIEAGVILPPNNDYYRPAGDEAGILESEYKRKAIERTRHTAQDRHNPGTCAEGDTEQTGTTGTHPFRGVPCVPSCAPENPTKEEIPTKDPCAVIDLSDNEEEEKSPILLPRGAVSELAKRWKASDEDVRESLKAWEECGRIVIVGEDIYEHPGNAYPKKDLPEEDDGQDEEDAAPPGPEKGEEGPGDSSSCGEDPGPVEEDPFTFMDA